MKDDLGPLPTAHPRHRAVNRAKRELLDFLLDWKQRNELTLPEELSLLADELSSILWTTVKADRRRSEPQEDDG